MYSVLQENGIPVPEHCVLNRSKPRELVVGDEVRVLNHAGCSCPTLTRGTVAVAPRPEDGMTQLELDWVMADGQKATAVVHKSVLNQGM